MGWPSARELAEAASRIEARQEPYHGPHDPAAEARHRDRQQHSRDARVREWARREARRRSGRGR